MLAVVVVVAVMAAITLVVVAVAWEAVPWLCRTVAWAPVGARK